MPLYRTPAVLFARSAGSASEELTPIDLEDDVETSRNSGHIEPGRGHCCGRTGSRVASQRGFPAVRGRRPTQRRDR